MQSDNSSVITPKGLKILRDVKLGDSVWNGDFWEEVVHIRPTTQVLMYDVSSSCGRISCSSDQEVYCKNKMEPIFKASHFDISIGPVFWEGVVPEKRPDLARWTLDHPEHLVYQLKKHKYSEPSMARLFVREIFSRFAVYENGKIVLHFPLKQYAFFHPMSLLLLMFGIVSVLDKDFNLVVYDGPFFIQRVGFATKKLDEQFSSSQYESVNYEDLTKITKRVRFEERPSLSLFTPGGSYWCEGALVKSGN